MTDRTTRASSPLEDLVEATRLTTLGRLDESMALIQRRLLGLPPAADVPVDLPRLPPAGEKAAREAPPAAPPALDSERVLAAVDSVVRGLGRSVAPVLKGLEGLAGSGLPRGQGPFPVPGSTPTPQPAASPRPEGGFVDGHFACAAGARDYKLFVPSRPQVPAPLVVMLHGCTQSPDDFAMGTGMNALAERDGLFVVYPGQTRLAHGQRCWNWYEARDQGREGGEAAIIAGMTRDLIGQYDLDPARIYIAGMSAGGAAAANIARAYPDLFAAVGVHSGLAAGCARDLSSALMAMQVGAPGAAPAPVRAMPAIVFHGDEDGTVSVRNAEQILAQAGIASLTPTQENFEDTGRPFTRTRYRDAEGIVRVEDWRLRGAGHAWSGGDVRGSYTDGRGPNASQAMLEFFARHRLPPNHA